MPDPVGCRRASRGRRWRFVLAAALAVAVLPWVVGDGEGPGLADLSERLGAWGRFHRGLVTPGSTPLWVLTPTALVVAFAGSLLLLFDRPPDWLRLPVGAVFLCLQAAYLAFRLTGTLCLDTVADALFSVLFLLSEASIHLRIVLGNLSLVHLTDRRAEADASARLVRSGAYRPTVDVFVPTYSEPVEMLERTIIGCQAMDYPRKTLWLLDDQRRPAMRALARRLGCRYLDRPDNAHAKAGNINHALARSGGELVLCLDADFIPTRDFLERTVGFFRDPQVAMVQTPQNFFNVDAVQRNLGLERALEDEQRLFFRALQPGRDAFNAIVCHGTSWVGRRSALEAIGGIPVETITEDWATSIRLQAAGYRLLYLNEALSAGMSADTCGEFVEQRSRWAQGTIQALFAPTNPLTIPGLDWRQRVLHASGILYYSGSLSNLFNLLAPLPYLFLGVCIVRMSLPEMLFFRLPLTVGHYMLYSWLTLHNRLALWTDFYDAFLAPSMGFTVLRSFCRPFGRGFRVTDKAHRPRRITLDRRVASPFLVLIALHLAGLATCVASGRDVDQPEVFPVVACFAAGNLVMLWVCLLASMDVRRARRFPRFEHRLDFTLEWEGGHVAGRTHRLSEGEATIRPREPMPPAPGQGLLTLPALGWTRVPVRLRRDIDDQWSLEFLRLSLTQRRSIVEFLYCRPGQWETPPKSEVRAVWEYARAAARMYPLAESP